MLITQKTNQEQVFAINYSRNLTHKTRAYVLEIAQNGVQLGLYAREHIYHIKTQL